MPGQPSFLVSSVAALASILAPLAAHAATPARVAAEDSHAHAASARTKPCDKTLVEVVAGTETAKLSLGQCAGKPGEPDAVTVNALSILARPSNVARPTDSMEDLAKKHGPELAPGVRRLDTRIISRLEQVVEHFAKDGQTPRLDLVSGFRPRGSGSMHSAGRALDFRIDGVKNDAIIAFCKTLDDTGCGYYPNNVFVHMDVREPGVGHVSWVDTSAPAEPAREIPAPACAVPTAPPAVLAAPAPARIGQIEVNVANSAPVEARPVPVAPPAVSMAVPVTPAEPKPRTPTITLVSPLPTLPAITPPTATVTVTQPAQADGAAQETQARRHASKGSHARHARHARHDVRTGT